MRPACSSTFPRGPGATGPEAVGRPLHVHHTGGQVTSFECHQVGLWQGLCARFPLWLISHIRGENRQYCRGTATPLVSDVSRQREIAGFQRLTAVFVGPWRGGVITFHLQPVDVPARVWNKTAHEKQRGGTAGECCGRLEHGRKETVLTRALCISCPDRRRSVGNVNIQDGPVSGTRHRVIRLTSLRTSP
jgi:hypothetical protein